MQIFRLMVLASCAGALSLGVLSAACGNDEAIVRDRLEGGTLMPDAGVDGALPCGALLPATYESAGFGANAAVELAFGQRFDDISTKMSAAEDGDGGVSAADLKAIYNSGAPSLRSVSTTATQTALDGDFDAFEAALGKAWTPSDPDQDGGAQAGGKYGAYYFSKVGVSLREDAEKTLLGGAFFNQVLGLVAAPVAEPTVDRLLAAFGAIPAALDDPDAGAENQRIAAFAAHLDSKSGAYRKMKTALLSMKAASAAGAKCDGDRDAAVTAFLSEWERTTFATAIYYLSSAATLAADPLSGPQALHAFGEAIGLIHGFKGLALGKPLMKDTQIDAILQKVGVDTAYKLVTSPGDRAPKLNEAINDIALYEQFSADEVEAFRKN